MILMGSLHGLKGIPHDPYGQVYGGRPTFGKRKDIQSRRPAPASARLVGVGMAPGRMSMLVGGGRTAYAMAPQIGVGWLLNAGRGGDRRCFASLRAASTQF